VSLSHTLIVLVTYFVTNSFGDRCFAVARPRLWNTLPVHLRQCDSLRQFKRLLKTICSVFGTAALCDALVRSAV